MSLPTLKIEEIQIEIALPPWAKPKVEKGEDVEEGQLLAAGVEEKEIKEIDLAKIFQVSPKKVGKFLKCSLGSKVVEGQVLAEKSGILGLGARVFKSPVSGVLEALTEYGVLKIKTESKKKEILSPIKGKVSNIFPQKIEIEFSGFCFTGSAGLGEENWGPLQILRKEEVDLRDLTSELFGSIIVVSGKITSGFCHKADALGILGLVAGDKSEEVESEDLIILLAGEKNGFIPKDILGKLERYQGKKVFISGKKKSLIIPIEER